MFKRSAALEKFIMEQESFSESAYEDFGRTSVGYGTKGTPGQKVTKDKAYADMVAHLDAIEVELGSAITRTDLPQNRKDVLLDIAYNMGTPRMLKTGIIDLVNQGKDQEVAELIGRLTKARDPKTKQLIELAGLKKRAELRRSMWDGVMENTSGSGAPDDLVADLDRLTTSSASDDDLLADFNRVATPMPSDRSGAFGLATDISSPEEADKASKVDRLVKEFGAPRGQVEALLDEYDEATVRMKLGAKDFVKEAPKTAEFASTPENNAIVKKDPDLFKRTEFLMKLMGGEKSDVTKALNTSFLRIDDGLLMMQVLNGQLDRAEAIKRLKDNESRFKANELNNSTKQRLMEAGEAWNRAWDTMTESEQKKTISEILSAGGDVAISAGAYFLEMFKDPMGWMAFQLENGGAGLIAGGFAGPIGRGSVEALSAYGGLVREKLEEYRDPQTGEIDYNAFLSDKEMIATLNKEASTYASTIGLISGAYQKVGGKLIAKNGMSGAAASAILGATSEGVGETGARTAGQVVSGQEVTMKENLQEGFIETLAGSPTAIASAGVEAIVNRSGAVKTGKVLSEAQKANDATAATSELKAQLQSNPLTEQFPEKIKEHIEAVSEEPITPVREVLTDSDPSERAISIAVENARNEDKTVAFSPSEWIAFNEDRGVDPLEALKVFSPEIRQTFADNKASDSSVVIPYADWVLATKEDPEIDVIARFGSNELNTLEANELIDAFQKNPMVFFDTEETTTSLTELVENRDSDWIVEEIESPDSYPVELKGPFATIEEGEAYNSFRNRLSRAMPKADKGFINDLALVELRRMRMRSEITGLPLDEVMKRIKFDKGEKSQVTTPTFDKNFFSVVLGENANPISAIHELAHVWLHEMAEDFQLLKDVDQETMTPDVRQYRQAMDDAVELLGLDSLDEILLGDMNKVTTAQEVFAQTAERYFMDNNSENSRVKSLMDRMRLWMLKYYDALRALAQAKRYPTLQMSPKVKSMFDSILAVSNASQDQVNALFPEPMFTRSDLGDSKISEAYFSDFQLARSQAWAEVAGKAILRTERENQRIFDEEYNRLWKEAEADIDNSPAMIFRAQMEDLYKEFKVKGGQDPRVSFESVRDIFFNGNEVSASEFKKQVPFFMMTGKKKGGLPVSSYMSMMNLDSPQTLKNLMLEAGKREDLIQAEVDSRLHEIQPKLKSKEEIKHLAEEAVAKEGRFKLIKREVEIMQERMGTSLRNLTADLINAASNITSKDASVALRIQAKLQIGQAKSQKFNAMNYYRDMNRFSKEAAKKFRAGDLEQAMSAKVKEAYKHFEFSEALKAEKRKVTAIARIKRLYEIANDPSALINTYDRVGIESAVAIINQVNQGIMPAEITMEAIKNRETTLSPEQIEEINKALDIFRTEGKKVGEDVTIDGIVALGNIARTAIKVSAQAKTIYKDGKKVALSKALDEDISVMGTGNVRSYENEKGAFLSRARVAKEKARAALSGLFSSDKEFLESNLGAAFTAIQKGEDLKIVKVAELKDRVRKKYDAIPLKWREKFISDKKLALLGKKGAPNFEFTIPDSEKILKFNNLDELETAMLHMGSESGARAITMGNLGLGEIFIPTVRDAFWKYIETQINEKKIPIEFLDVIQEKWNVMEDLYTPMQEELARTAGIEIGKVNGWKVKVAGRELEGRYFPKMRKKNHTEEDWMSTLNGTTDFLDIKTLPNKDLGITKKREHETAVEFNTGSFEAYVESATSLIYLKEPITSLSKMLLDPKMKEVLDVRRPGMLDNLLIPWMKRVILNQRVNPSNDLGGFESYIAYLRRNSGMVFFLGNIKTVLSQPLGLFPAAKEVGVVNLLKSAYEFHFSPKATIQETSRLSPAIRARLENDINLNIREEEGYRNERDVYSRLTKLSEKATYLPIHIFQTGVDIITWNAAYAKGMKLVGPEKAVAYADMTVKKTQGSSNVSELTNIQTHSELMRLFTAFSTVPLLNYEIMTEPFRRGNGSVPAQWIGAIQATAVVALMPAIIESIFLDELMEALKLKSEDEDEEEEKAMLSLLRGTSVAMQSLFLNPIPNSLANVGLKFAVNAGDKLAGTNVADSVWEGRATPALIKKLEDGFKGANAAQKSMFNSIPMTNKEEAKFWELLTLFTGMGIPFSGMARYNIYKDNSMSDNEKAIEDMNRRNALRRARQLH